MTLPTIEQARSWRGLTLFAAGEPVGRIDAVYVDRATRQPEWVLVHTGLFGNSRTFVPLADAAQVGDIVRVPHDPGRVREAPRLAPDVELSESDEARLYAHYGMEYTTESSPSGLPATDAGPSGSDASGSVTAGTAATTEPTRPIPAAGPTAAAPRLEADVTAVLPDRRAGGARRPLVAGLAALVLGAAGAAVAVLRARRRQPPSLGDRLAKAGRDAAEMVTRTGSSIRRASSAGASETARQAAAGGRLAARRAAARAAAGGAAAAGGRWTVRRTGRGSRKAARASEQVATASRQVASASRQVASASRQVGRASRQVGRASREAGRQAAAAGREAGTQAASGGRRFARRAAASGRGLGAAAGGTGAAVAAGGTEAARAAKRAGRRARRQAAAASAGAAKAVAGFPTAGGARMRRLDLGKRGRQAREQARQATPRRRRRSKMKVMGKLGMAVGAAVGYVLGARAGRERYEQIAASARQLMEKPQVKRVMESAPGNLGARVEQVAGKAADAVHQASDRVASSGRDSGATTGPKPVPTATGSGAEQGGPRRSAGTATTDTAAGDSSGTTGGGKRSSGGTGSRERPKPS
jgi:hypothetical protein